MWSSEVRDSSIIAPIAFHLPPSYRLILWSTSFSSPRISIAFKFWGCTSSNMGMQFVAFLDVCFQAAGVRLSTLRGRILRSGLLLRLRRLIDLGWLPRRGKGSCRLFLQLLKNLLVFLRQARRGRLWRPSSLSAGRGREKPSC